MIGCDVRSWFHRQHREGFSDARGLAPDAGDAKDPFVPFGEQPLVLALLLRIRRFGELVESVGDDQAAVGVELAAVGTEVIDRPLVLGPTPSTVNKLRFLAAAIDRAHDWTHIGDLDVFARRKIGRTLAKTDLDLEMGEVRDDRCHVHHQPVIVAHAFIAVLVVKLGSCYVLHMMNAKVFQCDAPLDERRVIMRRHGGDVEIVELPWGLRPRDGGPPCRQRRAL